MTALAVDFTNQSSLIAGSTAPSSGRSAGSVGGVGMVDGTWRPFVAKARCDTTLTGGTNTSTDKYYMIHVPVGWWVLRCWIVTITPELTGVTGTFAIGDSDSAAGYLTATIPSATAGGIISALYGDTAAFNVIQGRYYAVKNDIFLQVGTAAFANGVYDLYAMGVNCLASLG